MKALLAALAAIYALPFAARALVVRAGRTDVLADFGGDDNEGDD